MPDMRRFSVHGVAEAPSRSHLLEAAGFEEAALHFLAEFHLHSDAEEAVSLFVEDCETGERQCFRIDLESGETGPCG